MTPELKELCERLRRVESGQALSDEHTTCWHRNPDGPAAASAIETLAVRVGELEKALGRYRTPCGACEGTGSDDFRDHSHRCQECNGTGVARATLKEPANG